MNPRFEKRELRGISFPQSQLYAADLDGNGSSDLLSILADRLAVWIAYSDSVGFRAAVELSGLSRDCDWSRSTVYTSDLSALSIAASSSDSEMLCLARIVDGTLSVRRTPKPDGWNVPREANVRAVTDRRGLTTQLLADKSKVIRWRENGSTFEMLPEVTAPSGISIAAAGDLDGDGTGELIATSSRNSVLRCATQDTSVYCYLWLEVAGGRLTRAGLMSADFNGDGRTDVLERFNAISPAKESLWLGLSTAVTGIEREILGLAPELTNNSEFVTGDFNGDGADEILLPDRREERAEIWQLRPGRAVTEATVILDGSLSRLLSGVETFEFHEMEEGSHTIAIVQGGSERLRQQVFLRKGERLKRNFLLDDPTQIEGAAFSLQGARDGPALCLGYLPMLQGDREKWGGVSWSLCPSGYGIMASRLEKGEIYHELLGFAPNKRDGAYTTGTCCKLPASDMLTETQVTSLDQCPENTVATGVVDGNCRESCVALRCTQINTLRYQLGHSTPGVYWGIDIGMLHQNPRISRAEIPPALREAVGRNSFETWERDGCIGRPFGSLLVSKGINRCTGFTFREFQYAGRQGDPPKGTPIRMFPQCNRVSNPFDPLSRCD